ncbi:hypothetical protein I5393_05690 [Citrobacter freundii]|uniref:hypothetical protein n=1 Tax=Citrobacter freundii TaxID=546 RepID=UPI0019015CD2|nr:hypothetical protein [Citrobacter freundii]MBJ8767876.1 hypothetical protein [Citrobacter freundii]
MSTQHALGTNQQTITFNQAYVARILDAFEQTGELAYLRRVGTPYGFQIATRWAATKDNIFKTLSNPDLANKLATEASLRMLLLKIITSVNHFYAIDLIKGGDLQGISRFTSFTNFEKVFSNAFPLRLDENTGLPPNAGNFITAVEDMGDGIAVIFSYVLMKKISGGSKLRLNEYPVQYFNTVFIPNDLSRVEYRVDRKLGRRVCDRAITDLRIKFLEFLSENKVKLDLETVNFYKAIENIYNDANYGRLVQVDFVDPITDEDATLRCRSKPTYDARDRQVVQTNKGNHSTISTLKVCGVAARFDFTLAGESLVDEIGFDPNKTDWADNQFCDTFYFSKSAENVSHFGVINDILNRAV